MINSYDTLITACMQMSEDDSVEFREYLPTAIQIAELRLAKALDMEGLTTHVVLNTVPGQRMLAKPSDYLFPRRVAIVSGGTISQMERKTLDYMEDYAPVESMQGVPKFYGDYSDTEFYLVPTPNAALPIRLKYNRRLPALSPTNPTNFYTERCSNALYIATMSEMSRFLRAFDLMNSYEGQLEEEILGLNNEGRRSRKDDGTKTENLDPRNNSLRGDE